MIYESNSGETNISKVYQGLSQKFLLAFLDYGISEFISGTLDLQIKAKKRFKLHLLFL